MVGVLDIEIEQLDVKAAFLQGELEEQFFMPQAEGFFVFGKEDHVCLLKKSLYGLKQQPRQRYKRFDAFMISHGYARNSCDNCVYFRQISNGSLIYLLLFVNDMLIVAKNSAEINMLKDQLNGEFEMKDLGNGKKILGMEICRDRKAGISYLSQKKYIEKVLKCLCMENYKSVSILLASHFRLNAEMSQKTEEERENMSRVPYPSAVVSLMYTMVCTRHDLAHAVNPRKTHWQAVKQILRYLRGIDVCLIYDTSKITSGIVDYTYSDYGGDLVK